MMQWRNIASDVAVMRYPFRVFGIDFGRNVTLIRLRDGRLAIHSSAPFAAADIDRIRTFGQPSWIVDATLMHDTFAKEGRAAFPGIPYLAPPGFAKISGVSTEAMLPPPSEWDGQIEVLPIDGLRKREHAFFHHDSRTLIVADLLFHFSADKRGWPRFFVRHMMRLPRLHGVSVFFKMLICDRQVFERSMAILLELNFTQMIVAHSEPIQKDAKAILRKALSDRGFAIGS